MYVLLNLTVQKGFKALVLPKKMYLLKNVSGHVDEFVSSLKTI